LLKLFLILNFCCAFCSCKANSENFLQQLKTIEGKYEYVSASEVVEELNLLADVIKRRKEEKKSLSLISDIEEDCAVTKSEHLQTEFIL
jgi:hypothetical protein